MSNEEFRCSRKYLTEWSKLIKRRFSDIERLERAESSASEKLEDVSDALNERLKEISDRREKAFDELAIAALDCLQLPSDDQAACQENVTESGKKIISFSLSTGLTFVRVWQSPWAWPGAHCGLTTA